MAERRHLPIAGQSRAPEPGSLPDPMADEERPPWHWSGIGAVLIFVLWLPLAMVGQWVSGRLVGALLPPGSEAELAAYMAAASGGKRLLLAAASVGPLALGFAVACVAGGALVGRHGGAAGRKEATVAGLAAASTAWALTAAASGLGASWFLWPPIALLGSLFGWAGGVVGLRLRPRKAA
jgi:hypothetical protein